MLFSIFSIRIRSQGNSLRMLVIFKLSDLKDIKIFSNIVKLRNHFEGLIKRIL